MEGIYFGYFATLGKKNKNPIFPIILEEKRNVSGFVCFLTGDNGDHINSCN